MNAEFKTLDIRPEGQFYVAETTMQDNGRRLLGDRLSDDFATKHEADQHLNRIVGDKPDAYLMWFCHCD